MGYSPWGHKELGTTERLHFHFHSALREMMEDWCAPHPRACLPCTMLCLPLRVTSVDGHAPIDPVLLHMLYAHIFYFSVNH